MIPKFAVNDKVIYGNKQNIILQIQPVYDESKNIIEFLYAINNYDVSIIPGRKSLKLVKENQLQKIAIVHEK